ncbi:signal peptidase I [Lentibacillus sp. N15]
MAEPKKKNEWVEWGKAIFIAILLALFLKVFVFATSIVEGESMVPTLEDGERVIINKFVYLFGEPKRGDIVIIKRPDKNYVKRVIALPGETVEMEEHQLYINGKKLNKSFVSKDAANHTGSFGPIQVPDDSYFVMGDNRAISMDSRNGLGFINRDTIIGKSAFVIYPFDEWKKTK